jgi:hypothetical protein
MMYHAQGTLQSATMAEFTKVTYEALMDIDRRCYQHCISFKAQDDNWSKYWKDRTGITTEELQSANEAALASQGLDNGIPLSALTILLE